MLVALLLKDGTKAWEYKTDGPIKSSPVAVRGRLFVASYDGHLYAFK
jgi:outer membrane protein assembly factor BamB